MTAPAFLLVKRGLYYAHNSQGYTGIKDRAGRYLESDASPTDGVTAIHEEDAPMFAPACWQEVKVDYLLGKIAELERAAAARPDMCGKSDADLLADAVRNARSRRSRGYVERWVAVMETFACGSTLAFSLCWRFGFNPNEEVRR